MLSNTLSEAKITGLQKYVLRGAMLGTNNIPIKLGNALPECSSALLAMHQASR